MMVTTRKEMSDGSVLGTATIYDESALPVAVLRFKYDIARDSDQMDAALRNTIFQAVNAEFPGAIASKSFQWDEQVAAR